MPYKDPEKQRAAVAAAQRRYAAKNPEKVRELAWKKHQKKLEVRRAQRRARNRAVGHQERPKGPQAKPEIVVPLSRRWTIFTGADGVTRLYFTSKKGFEYSEMQEILRTFKDLRARQLALAANLIVETPVKPKTKRKP